VDYICIMLFCNRVTTTLSLPHLFLTDS
jgi:hypothetical protein